MAGSPLDLGKQGLQTVSLGVVEVVVLGSAEIRRLQHAEQEWRAERPRLRLRFVLLDLITSCCFQYYEMVALRDRYETRRDERPELEEAVRARIERHIEDVVTGPSTTA